MRGRKSVSGLLVPPHSSVKISEKIISFHYLQHSVFHDSGIIFLISLERNTGMNDIISYFITSLDDQGISFRNPDSDLYFLPFPMRGVVF